MFFQSQLYQFLQQLRCRFAHGCPELRIHADIGETRKGVDLVEHDSSVVAVEEIATGQPSAVQSFENFHRIVPNLIQGFFRKIVDDSCPGFRIVVLRIVIVEFIGGQDLSHAGSLRLLVAQEGHLDFSAGNHFFHQNLVVIEERILDGRAKVFRLLHLVGTHRRSGRRRFHEKREVSVVYRQSQGNLFLRVFVVFVFLKNTILGHIYTGHRRQLLGHGFIHGIGRSANSRSAVRNLRQFEQALNISVLAVVAVKHRDDAVDSMKLCVIGLVENQETMGYRVRRNDRLTVIRSFFPVPISDFFMGGLGCIPASRLGNSHHKYIVAVLLQSGQHIDRRVSGHFMLIGFSPKDNC